MLTYNLKASYLAMIMNSVGCRTFQQIFCVDEKGKLVDVCQSGLFSCFVFVSNVLKMHNLIETPRATRESFEEELINCGWTCKSNPDIDFLCLGDVLIWKPRLASDGTMHMHGGFYLKNYVAVSNDPRNAEEGSERTPIMHPVTFGLDFDGGDERKVQRVWRHPLLD